MDRPETLTRWHEVVEAKDPGRLDALLAELDGLTVHGIDMFRWDVAGRITEFTVMVRPFKGLQKLMELVLIQLVPES